ncbi:TetR/AcrR family transcriptional regulator [Longispora albida]|uniref:TetR/AcrR family transcriptional regulator n=1 Tax=Longispora albida TaxID=203523 RepID=UPI00146DA843|nr:TetR/AcrR family transcriptional regulator [Longispora albida]
MNLPVPPWQTPKKRPAKQPLSREAIVAAALTVLDAEGLDALTMRRLAEELGTGPASLYAHVKDKEELYDLLIDAVCAEVRVPEASAEDWEERVKDFVRESVRVLTSHRDIGRIAMARIPTGFNVLRVADGMLGVLKAGGLSDQDCAWAVDILSLYANAHSYESSLFEQKLAWQENMLEVPFFEQLAEYYKALPADTFPNLAPMAAVMLTGNGDDRFEFGLDLLVRGLASRRPTVSPEVRPA